MVACGTCLFTKSIVKVLKSIVKFLLIIIICYDSSKTFHSQDICNESMLSLHVGIHISSKIFKNRLHLLLIEISDRKSLKSAIMG